MPRIATLVLLCIAALVAVALPASAAITDIPSGGTVFIGEQGLNIAATNVTAGSQIAHFAGGGNVQTDAPSDLVAVSDPASFYVSPAQFGSATGAWYTFPGRQLAFIIKDPSLALTVINGLVIISPTVVVEGSRSCATILSQISVEVKMPYSAFLSDLLTMTLLI
jgi:hypothetical protein